MQLSVPDPRGKWSFVDATGAARLVRADSQEALRVGMAVELSDVLRTERARVVLRLSTGEQLVISEGSELVLGDRSVIQTLGEVYYQLKTSFSIEYRTVRATVDGTELLVGGPTPDQLIVTRGLVRVAGLEGGPVEGEVEVRGGQVVMIPTSGAMTEASRWSWNDRSSSLSHSWALGRPWILFGLGTGGGLTGGTPTGLVRMNARLALPPSLRLVIETGLDATPGNSQLGLPLALGLDLERDAISMGVQLTSALASQSSACGSSGNLDLGVQGVVRTNMFLSRQLGLEATLRSGYSSTWTVDGTVGLIATFL